MQITPDMAMIKTMTLTKSVNIRHDLQEYRILTGNKNSYDANKIEVENNSVSDHQFNQPCQQHFFRS